jgi:hypothetical protein
MGNSVDGRRGFGIIRDAALFSGYAPDTVKSFWSLWNARNG